MRRSTRLSLLLAALVALAVTLSACAGIKPGTFQITQPGGIGPLHYVVTLCSEDEGPETCEPSGKEGDGQQMLVLAVPKGATAPATVTAVPGPGASPMVFNRDPEVAAAFNATFGGIEGEEWPPPGSELVGYMTGVIDEVASPEVFEWTIDAEIGLPSGADGGSFGGPVEGDIGIGWRLVDGTHPPDRPINCFEGEPPFVFTGVCEIPNEFVQAGVSDLKIPTASPVTANVGATASIPFTLDFASSASTRPSFDLSGSTTLPGGTVTVAGSPFAPGAPPAGTSRYAPETRTAAVGIPATTKPGTYSVTFSAKAGGGGAVVTSTALLTVVKPKIGFGKLSFNRKKGTATLQVKVFESGTLTASGRGIVKAQKRAGKAKTLKVTIRAKGKAKKALSEAGKAKVKAQFKFKPLSGAAVTKSRSIVLKKTL
jgi:hypothetical protein